MKKLLLLTASLVLSTVLLSCATTGKANVSVDEIKNHVLADKKIQTSGIEAMSWVFPEQLNKVKNEKLDNVYALLGSGVLSKFLKRPNNERDLFYNISFIGKYYYDYNIYDDEDFLDAEDLNKGDLFFMPRVSGGLNLWLLTGKRIVKDALLPNGNILQSATFVMKYKGWSFENSKSDVKSDDTYQTNAMNLYTNEKGDIARIYSLVTPSKGEISIMIIDLLTNDVKEYSFQYIGEYAPQYCGTLKATWIFSKIALLKSDGISTSEAKKQAEEEYAVEFKIPKQDPEEESEE